MKKIVQALVTVPISEAIGRAFGGNTLVGTGAALLTARVVTRSFPGMLVLGAIAGALNYIETRKIIDANDAAKASDKTPKPA